MSVLQTTSRIPSGLLRHKFVMRQNPPAPVHFTATALTQTGTIFGLPPKHVVVGVMVKLVTTFSAFGMSSCLVVVGAKIPSGSSVANYYSPSFECTQLVDNQSFMYWSPLAAYTSVAHDVTATFTATGAQLATMTAGEVEFTVLYRPL